MTGQVCVFTGHRGRIIIENRRRVMRKPAGIKLGRKFLSYAVCLGLAITFLAAGAEAASRGVCSTSPINPARPPASKTSFKAGDRIYCVLMHDKTWAEMMNDPYANGLIMEIHIDGVKKTGTMVELKNPELFKRKYFVMDIAPDPDKMTTYKDKDVVFAKRDGQRFGPELFTKYLSELSPGKHKVQVSVQYFGKPQSEVEFEIEGGNFSSYAALLSGVKGAAGAMQTMPKAGLTDRSIEGDIKKSLAKSGVKNVARVVITDTNWWIDRASGGNSAVVSRHLAAAVAVKEGKGCGFSVMTFYQPKLITGAWGQLELRRKGDMTSLPCANVNK